MGYTNGTLLKRLKAINGCIVINFYLTLWLNLDELTNRKMVKFKHLLSDWGEC